jgi:hypothetical protein
LGSTATYNVPCLGITIEEINMSILWMIGGFFIVLTPIGFGLLAAGATRSEIEEAGWPSDVNPTATVVRIVC